MRDHIEVNRSDVLARDDGAARVITLNRPDRLNAFTAASYLRLAEVLDEASSDPEVGVIVLRGAGRSFSSGVDTAAWADIDQSKTLAPAFEVLLESLSSLTKPLVAGVHGHAVGFGLTILLYCDVVIVARDARLRAPFTALGTVPEAASSLLLARAVGTQRAAELMLTARWFDGAEAERIGFAARCCDPESVQDEALAVARQIAANDQAATQATKRLLRYGWWAEVRAALGRELAESSRLLTRRSDY